jgi:hypothetical protein
VSRATSTETRGAAGAAAGRLHPDRRRRLGRAVALWGGWTLASVAALAALAIWHLIRRGRLIRDRQPPPRTVRLPDLGGPEA